MLSLYCSPLTKGWNSDEDDEAPFSPVMRKKAVKVKHVKRREKKFDKKVSSLEPFSSSFEVLPGVRMVNDSNTYYVLFFSLSRRSPGGTNRSRSTKTKPDPVRRVSCGTARGTGSVSGRAVCSRQEPAPSTALRSAA